MPADDTQTFDSTVYYDDDADPSHITGKTVPYSATARRVTRTHRT